MKLRNKKTGELVEFNNFYEVRGGKKQRVYSSLADLNKEWEDYEEMGYWYIDFDGDVLSCVEPFDDETEQERKEIGNYFDTREEAEKAVEKLKAWKRLRDRYGFAFNGKVTDSKGKFCGVRVKYDNEAVTMKEARQAEHDVAILFGGEE